MSDKQKFWLKFSAVWLLVLIGFFTGYRTGKGDADRWWEVRITVVEKACAEALSKMRDTKPLIIREAHIEGPIPNAVHERRTMK